MRYHIDPIDELLIVKLGNYHVLLSNLSRGY